MLIERRVIVKIYVDVSRYTFFVASDPEPVLDRDTQAQKVNKSGQQMFRLQTVARADNRSEIWSIKVPGKPPTLAIGTPVRITGLIASSWSIGDRSDVAFSADKIESALATH